MNGVIMRKVVVQASYTNLVPEKTLVGTVTISCAPGNAGSVNFRGDDGSDVPWVAGEWHEFKGVDLRTSRSRARPATS